MLKMKTFIILIIVYLLSFLALKLECNLFYPYYLLKDLLFFPVLAYEDEIILSDTFEEGILIEQQKEIEELKKLHDIKTTLTEFDTISALVIERNRMYWFNTITINKGSDEGIGLDMAVITGDGLLGKVNKVSKKTSEIKLLTTNDQNSKISVMIKDEDDIIYGIMQGYDNENNYLEVTGVNKQTEIKEGSFVYTSGMGGVFPSGILIGQVIGNSSDKYEVGKIIYVKPSSNFNDFRFVSVLMRK